MKKGEGIPVFKPFGWQGIGLEVPEDWIFSVESGGQQQGFVRLVSNSSSFELKWEKMEKKKKFSIESVMDNLIKKLQKADKNLKLLNKSSSKVFGHKAFYFHFESKYKGYGSAWYCEKGEKVFLGLFSFKPECKEARLTFNRCLTSLKCHVKNEWNTWALLGFSFRVPSKFELKERKFLVGHTTLVLSKEESHPFCTEKREALFQYWSPANVKFEGTYNDPKKWFEEFYEKELKKRYEGKIEKGKYKSLKINGHPAKTLRSTMKMGLVGQAISKNSTHMWYCPETNRIYALTLSKGLRKMRFIPSKKYEAIPVETFNKILASVSCH
jgi:hypothetical protein